MKKYIDDPNEAFEVLHEKSPVFFQPTEQDIITDLNDALFVPIDVQKKYADYKEVRGSKETEIAAKEIARLAPEFNHHGLRSCWVYFAHAGTTDGIDFHHVKPANDDFLAKKMDDSAFGEDSFELEKLLKQEKTKTLFICGFNANACVLRTVFDALNKKYKVYIIDDLTEDDINGQNYIEENGGTTYSWFFNELTYSQGKYHYKPNTKSPQISIIQSSDLLSALKQRKKYRLKP